jgi:hypothetical protein
VSKIRQAVDYERQLVKAKVKAHVELTAAELRTERKLREQAIFYERKYTDGQFGQLRIVADEHRLFHEREHLLYEDAIDKASASLNSMLASLQADVDRFREEATKWMTVERFEREHETLADKMELANSVLAQKVAAEEKVTVRSEAQQALLESMNQNRRWLIGIGVTLAIFGITTLIGLGTTVLHALGVI